MSLEADRLVDRRRLKRQLTVWRVAAIVLAAGLVVVGVGEFTRGGDHVARMAVSGIITVDRQRDEDLRRIADDSSARALIVRFNSPGGTVVGGEDLYRRLRFVAERKPVVAVLDTLGTSAAYMAALGADRIVAHEGTITGSIGVILQATEFSGLLKSIGVSTEAIKSGPLKAVPSPFEPMTPAGREATRTVVMDIFRMFVDLVAERRGIERPQVLRLADGRVFTGRQALNAGLIDALGGEAEARIWLEKKHGIPRGLPIRDVGETFGFSPWRALVSLVRRKTVLSETLTLDGLVSVWHAGVH